MLERLITQTFIPIQPLEDTWGSKGDAGTWYINLDLNFTANTTQEINTWYEKIITDTLDSFRDLARVWKVSLSPSNHEKFKGVVLEWQPEESYEAYFKKISKAIERFPDVICILEMFVDLLVFVRTEESPHKPIRTWVRYLGKFSFCGGLIHRKPFMYLDMEHTLFSPSSFFKEDDNSELYSLNQPLLKTALGRWEEKFDAEIEPDGLPGIYKYGFLPDEDEED